jgi:hypothetical protein
MLQSASHYFYIAAFCAWIASAMALNSCSNRPSPKNEALAQHHIAAMEGFNIAFLPGANLDSLLSTDGWSRKDAGRLVSKAFKVPRFRQAPEVTITLSLKSTGDPWDKSGAVLILHDEWAQNIEQDSSEWPGIEPNAADGFTPALELLRFITPFGVGHYSDTERSDEYRPVYIPKWEQQVSWQNDISHLWSAMEDSITLAVYLDTWSAEGHELDLNLTFKSQPEQVAPRPQLQHLTLVNTTKFHANQSSFDGFATHPLNLNFQLPESAENAVLHYIPTGHGGHSEGDEFVPCRHIISLNNDTIAQFTPWRDDCASFRRFNPSSGVWTERTYWRGDSIDERIASSDYSRSGWCPGSDVPAMKFHLGELEAGPHQLTIDVPDAQHYTDAAMNFWNVAAYLTWQRPEEL